MSTIKMGEKGRDIVTGFTGTCTGLCQYISGCVQVLLVPPVDKDGKLVGGEWFDTQRIVPMTEAEPIKLDNSATPGPDQKPARNV